MSVDVNTNNHTGPAGAITDGPDADGNLWGVEKNVNNAGAINRIAANMRLSTT
jgi:hypothetical protein